MSSILKTLQESGQAKAVKSNTFSAVLSVLTAVKTENGLELTGKVMNHHPSLSQDEVVKVVFRTASERAITNFLKGNGRRALEKEDAAKGSFLTLEGCYIERDKDDAGRTVLNARWLTTLAQAGNPEHENRSFLEGVVATAPRIIFDNPEVKPGEPSTITLPVNAEKVTLRVDTERGRVAKAFDAAWAIEKLKHPQVGKPQVVIDVLVPSEAVKCDGLEAFKKALTEQLSAGTRAISMLRVYDGEEVIARAVYGQYKKDGDAYVPDPEKTLESLLGNNIFRGINNDALFGAVAEGKVTLEAIPGYRMTYAGDPTRDDNAAYKLIEDVKEGNRQHYQMIFGTNGDDFANVLLPGIARTERIAGFSPINVLGGSEPGVFKAAQLKTPHVDPKVAPSTLAVAPDEDDDEPASARVPADVEEPMVVGSPRMG